MKCSKKYYPKKAQWPSQKRQIARRQPERIAIKFTKFFSFAPKFNSDFFLVFCGEIFLHRPPKRAFACSVSSNGTVCSRLAVNSDFFSFSPFRCSMKERRLVMVIWRSHARVPLFSSSFLFSGIILKAFFYLLMESCGHQRGIYEAMLSFLSKKVTYHD